VSEIPESHRDLLNAKVGTLATVGPDGRPQLSEVWFIATEGGAVKISLNSKRQKVKNLLRNASVSFLILDLENPYRYLELRWDAELQRDVDYSLAEQVGAKYDTDLRNMDDQGDTRYAVTIPARHVNAVDVSG